MKSAPSKMRVFGILILGGLLVYFTVKFFTGKAPIIDHSEMNVRRPPTIESVPGSVKDNVRYKELQEKENIRRADEAKKKGVSALPTLVNRLKDEKTDEQFFEEAGKAVAEAPVEKNTREESLRRAQEEADRRLKAQQERLDKLRQEQDNRRQAAANARQNERDNKDRQKLVQDLSGAYLADINNLITPLRNPPRQSYVFGAEVAPAIVQEVKTGQEATPLYKAGSIIYGVIVSNYDSDSPGTVRARIVSGPLAGATLLGTVGAPSSEFTKYVPVTFNKLSRPQAPNSQDINLRVIDAQTQMPGVQAQANYHYGQRYGAMVLSGLLTQVSNQIQDASSGTQETAVQAGTANATQGNDQGAGATTAGGDTANVDVTTPVLNDVIASLNTTSARPVTYKIAQGTPIGLMFENDFVLEF